MGDKTGFHENYERNDQVKGSSDRSFGLVFAGVFGLIAGLSIFRGHLESGAGLAAASLVFLALAYGCPGLLAPLNRLWYRFGLLLHAIVNPLVMGLIYVVCFVPIGLIIRFSGKDPLQRRFDPEARSYWIRREPPGPVAGSMSNQF